MNKSTLPIVDPILTPLLRFWPQLSEKEQKHLIGQIEQIDLSLIHEQRKILLRDSFEKKEESFEPFSHFAFSGNLEDQVIGRQAIAKGELGCIMLAGGQGSRFRSESPKGVFPISLIKHKSLFQLAAEKVLAAGHQVGRRLLLAIMVSPQNEAETRAYFTQSHYFGLDPTQVSFFTQDMLPFLDKEGYPFLETSSEIAMGPNGNGCCFKAFVRSGLAAQWAKQGVHYLNIILVDNPLADPFDAELLGFHIRQQAEVTIKGTEKQEPEEKVGVIVKSEQGCRVIEYSEMPEIEKRARTADGQLKHCCANLSLYCFSLNFILTFHDAPLPLHPAWKSVRMADREGNSQLSQQPNAWKFESFIFDILGYAHSLAVLLYPRNDCFAPLKNLTGADSPDTVRASIQHRERQLIQHITGKLAPNEPFELAADFYYPTPSLLAKWKHQDIPIGYIKN